MLTFCIENAEISQIKGILVLKTIFSETTMCLYLRTKLQVFSINLTSFSPVVILLPSPTAKQTSKKPTQITAVQRTAVSLRDLKGNAKILAEHICRFL